jgi:hypothetical protein
MSEYTFSWSADVKGWPEGEGEHATKQEVTDMFDFLVAKGFINLKEFEEFKKNRELIEKID